MQEHFIDRYLQSYKVEETYRLNLTHPVGISSRRGGEKGPDQVAILGVKKKEDDHESSKRKV